VLPVIAFLGYGTFLTSLSFIVIGLLFPCVIAAASFLGNPSKRGWGTSSAATFREADTSSQSTLINVWLANAPQLIVSFCYVAINSEYTAMAGASEWNSLATSRKVLRVTRPVGEQRETYFLQLPYRWSLPLIVASGGLHWLLSQSIFVVGLETYDTSGKLVRAKSQSACGFSGTSFTVLTLAFNLVVGVVGMVGRRKFRVRIPFAGSSSLVVNTACHPPSDDLDPHLRPVQWGAVVEKMYDGEDHCTLSSQTVYIPTVGGLYL
jgi:hypothetical protein